MARGYLFQIEDDPSMRRTLDPSDFDENEYIRAECAYLSTADLDADDIVTLFQDEHLDVAPDLSLVGSDRTKQAYFAPRLDRLRAIMQDMSLEHFCDNPTATALINCIDNTCENLILYKGVLYTIERFVRTMENGHVYYIADNALILH